MGNFQEHISCKLPGRFPLNLVCRVVYIQKIHLVLSSLHIWYFIMSPVLYKYCAWKVLFTGDKKYASIRDKYKSILLLSIHLFFFLGIHFFLPIILKILLKTSICFSNFSYIASYLTVTSYTLYTSTAYIHHGQL